MLHTKSVMSEHIYTQIWDVFCPNLCYIRKCDMSEPMLRTKLWCLVSDVLLHTKMFNVWTDVTHEHEMFSVPTYSAYKKIWTYITHAHMMFLVQNDTYDNIICPNLCNPKKHDIFCPNLRYIRIWVMSEHMLQTNMRCIMSELMLHTKM